MYKATDRERLLNRISDFMWDSSAFEAKQAKSNLTKAMIV